ncbi:hypothetical protein OAM26_01680 [Porticoccaceae bacterium]|nr:hypothetical protein [Porticoccaceae bacterium]
MKWKTVLTAEEAALFATGIDGFKSIEKAKTKWVVSQIAPVEGQEVDEELGEKVQVAEEIYEALLAEIIVADPSDNQPYLCGATSLLEVAMRVQRSEEIDFICPEKCTVTKLSLAKWFWQHDHDIAKKFWPSITEELVYPPQQNQVKPAINIEPATKSKNSYLKTIAALSSALIGGLTGKPTTDAEAVLAALAGKNVEAPIKDKALANYLKEAGEL